MQLECNCRKLHRRICNWKKQCMAMFLKKITSLTTTDTMLQVCLSTEWTQLVLLLFAEYEWTQLVLLLFARRQVTSTLHEGRDKTNTFKSYKRPTWQAIVLNYIKTYRQFPLRCVCFSSYIFFWAVSCSCIPVANSSCKFQLQILFPLGEAFASSSIIETWHLIRICLLSFCACECFPQWK